MLFNQAAFGEIFVVSFFFPSLFAVNIEPRHHLRPRGFSALMNWVNLAPIPGSRVVQRPFYIFSGWIPHRLPCLCFCPRSYLYMKLHLVGRCSQEIPPHQTFHDLTEDLWAAVEGGYIVHDMTTLSPAINDYPYFLSDQDPSAPSIPTVLTYHQKVRYSKCPATTYPHI